MKREEEIKQAAATYILEMYGEVNEDSDVAEGFREGAKWADENPTHCSLRMVGSQSYLKQQLREMGFAFDLNGNVLSPNHLAEKAAQYVIEKACEWLVSELYHSEDRYGHPNVESRSYVSVEDFIKDFKKAMES